jgi:hypothetical protein
MIMTFGSNENLILVLVGDHTSSIITLLDDSSGLPVERWSYVMTESASSNNHIISNLKASVSLG